MKRKVFLYAILCLTLLLLPRHTSAAELVVNGGFETGDFTGWTVVNPTANASPYYRPWQVSPSGAGGGFNPLPTTTVVQQGNFNAWSGVVTGSAAQEFRLTQDITIPTGRFVRMTWNDRYQVNYTICGAGCGTANYRVELVDANTNVLLQTLYLFTTNTNTNTNTGYISHLNDLTAYQGRNLRLRFRTWSTGAYPGPGQLEVDAVSVQTLQLTTAGRVSVGGRVVTADGAGIPRTTVTLTDSAGNTRSAITGSFGYYNFDEVESGSTYTLTVNNKRYLFADSPRVVSVQESISDMDFVAAP